MKQFGLLVVAVKDSTTDTAATAKYALQYNYTLKGNK